ncbi:Pre-mRNA-splicing factor ATP-dependent RNA helicase prp16 [Spathaspora sp. JA1]|nr:Pre-mRNA-splicing factor ATP-dependent RNA helicase prp16 [Spathaspora sp. JA1]
MNSQDDILSKITNKLTHYLNKPIHVNLTKSIISQFEKNNSFESFSTFVTVLGLTNTDQVKELFQYISDNYSIIEKSLRGKGESDTRLEVTPVVKPKSRLKLSFDDELELQVKPKVRVRPVSVEDLDKPVVTKFKKMKKQDALRIKQETATATPVPTATTDNKPVKELTPLTPDSLSPELNIETEREWYTIDEEGGTHDTIPEYTRLPTRTHTHTGYTQTGEYIDSDHTPDTDLSRIPILNHVFIPPFLQDSQEYLQLQVSTGSIRGLGPTVNPIKDSTSELANMARTGSLTVQTRRSKKERALQAKARTGVELEPRPEEKAEKVDIEETKEDASTIVEQRRNLPAFAVKHDLITTIRDNQVTIIIGETGSGKTTQLTQYLYEEGFTNINGTKQIIACTQPRRVAAMSVAKRVSEEMGCVLGQQVGFSIRFEDRTDHTTVIKYMTEGILLREILVDPILSKYSCIIIDEAHERSLNTDILLGLFRNLLMKRRDLKLIVTSATMNADKFTRFFGSAPQFTIPGRTYPVEVFFNKSTCSDYVEAAVKQILTVHLRNSTTTDNKYINDGDILVFMTGQEDIEITCDLLREKLDLLESPPPLDIYPIYSTMPSDLQRKIFTKKNLHRRKVVVATNIAETSLTVDGIKYVIDCGLVKVKLYNPKLSMDTLQIVPISLANAEQRSGRAGRLGPGVSYRLYTERAIDSLYLQPIPEIQRTNLCNSMLLLKSLHIEDVTKFPFLDPPPKDLLNCSLYDLWAIGALDNLGELTTLGKSMTKFPIEPTLAKLILLSTQPAFHCSQEMITIVAMLSVPNIFQRPKERAKEADIARDKFIIAESDHLTLLNVYNQWNVNLTKRNINAWCSKNFLQLKSLLRVRDIRKQLVLIMQSSKLPLLKSRSDDDIRKCLAAAFYQQAAKLSKMNLNGNPEFINLRHGYMKMYLHPTSSLLDSNLSSNFVVYHELILTTKEYMNYVTVVEPIWLLEFGYKFYSISEQNMKKYNVSTITKSQFEQELAKDGEIYQEKLNKLQSKRTTKQTTNKLLFKSRRAI